MIRVGGSAYGAVMTRLAPGDYLDHIGSESARFRAVLAECDPAARVPGCPDWTAADLLWHLAEVQWFWSQVIRRRPGAPDDLDHPDRPDSYAALLAAFDESSVGLLSALSDADPAEPAWSWASEQTVGFTYRRQAHEALIHRLDAEQTAGIMTTPLDPVLGADGVAEALDVMYGGHAPAWGRIEPGPHHVRIDLTDVARSLWVQPCTFLGTHPETQKVYDGPHVLLVPDPGGEPDAVIAGTAADLDAWLWKRGDDREIARSGEPQALEALVAAVSPALD